jgi:hypothetical protein
MKRMPAPPARQENAGIVSCRHFSSARLVVISSLSRNLSDRDQRRRMRAPNAGCANASSRRCSQDG